MVMNIANAISAYTKGGNISSGISDSVADTGSNGSFMDTLKGFAGDTVKSLQEGEKAATASVTGNASIANVVTALNSAELMLQTVTTIRDKVIAAYQDITKTPI